MRNLSAYWDDFVDPPKRLATLGPFLRAAFARFAKPASDIRILDTCMGAGHDVAWLTRAGYDVSGNEADAELLRVAQRNLQGQGINLNGHTASSDWSALSEHFEPGSFDVVLCLGNSLCLLENEDQILEAIRQFHVLTKKGGILIMDERNFLGIIKANGWENGHFKNRWQNFPNPGSVLYCGSGLRAAPKEITADGRMIFSYTRFSGEGIALDEVGTLAMQFLLPGKLSGFARRAEFSDRIEHFADLQPLVENFIDSRALFFTHICPK
jgi:SAM-dependent methyltransferase